MKQFNKYKRQQTWMIIIGMLCIAIKGHAQKERVSEVAKTIWDLRERYSKADHLSFTVHYTYANENTPEQILDSSVAEVTLDGHKYHCRIDSTEVFADDSLTVILFRQEKIMYLARARQATAMYNPMLMLDSTLQQDTTVKYTVIDTAGGKELIIDFPAGNRYKKIKMQLGVNGCIREIEYVVKTELLADEKVTAADLGGYDTYAVVRAEFYSNDNSGSTTTFIPGDFFVKGAAGLKPTAPYSNYSIFIGSAGIK